MAVSEQTIQEAIQDALQAMSEFSDSDITINSWTFLDNSTQAGPFVVIENSDNFVSRQQTVTAINNFEIPFTLFDAVDAVNDATTLNSFRDHRQAILDACNTEGGTVRTAGGLAGIMITEIRNDGPITPWFDPTIPTEQLPWASPLYLYQRMLLSCEEF